MQATRRHWDVCQRRAQWCAAEFLSNQRASDSRGRELVMVWLIAVPILVLGCGEGGSSTGEDQQGMSRVSGESAAVVILVDSAALETGLAIDLGSVQARQSTEVILQVHNETPFALRASQAAASCTCVAVGGALTIGAGEHGAWSIRTLPPQGPIMRATIMIPAGEERVLRLSLTARVEEDQQLVVFSAARTESFERGSVLCRSDSSVRSGARPKCHRATATRFRLVGQRSGAPPRVHRRRARFRLCRTCVPSVVAVGTGGRR